MSDTSTHNLPQQRFAQQMQDWKPLAAFREALRAGDVLEALRLNTFLGLTQETIAAHQALLLLWIEDMAWWQHPTGGYGPWESFAECATALTGRGRSTCGDLVRTWRWWREKGQTKEQWIRHCQLIGWAACREIRRADIPAAEIETVVEAISQTHLKQPHLRAFLAQYKPSYRPRQERWARWQVKCSPEGRRQMEAIFNDLAEVKDIDRLSAGANDQLVAHLHTFYFQGRDEEGKSLS